ncbi:hypothetical protein ACTXT7_000915 [Hymenolepis weldensis]
MPSRKFSVRSIEYNKSAFGALVRNEESQYKKDSIALSRMHIGKESKNKEGTGWREVIAAYGLLSNCLVIEYNQRYAAGIMIADWLERPLLVLPRLLAKQSIRRPHFPECSSAREIPLISLGSAVNFIARRFIFCHSEFQALAVTKEVADELHLNCSKLPPPYWSNVYLKDKITNGTITKFPLQNGHCVVERKENGDTDIRKRA